MDPDNPGWAVGAHPHSERRFHALAENALDIVMVTDPEGTISYLSPSVERVLGYTSEEMIGTNTAEYVHPDDLERASGELEVLLSRPGVYPEAVETRVRHKDGSWRHLEGMATNLLDDPAVEGLVFNQRDVTDRVRAEEEVRRLNRELEKRVAERTARLEALVGELGESEQRFRATFEQAAVGVAHVGPDGRWLRVNDKLCEILGYSRKEMLRLNLQDIAYPEDHDADLEYVRRVLAGEIASYSMEKRYFRKDGSLIWANLAVSLVRGPSGEPEYFIGAIEDITERKQAEEQLREKEVQYRDIFEATGDGLVITDLDGNLVDANPAFCSMHGYDSCELLVGRHTTAWLHPDHHRLHNEYVATIKAAGRFQAQAVDVRKDGTSFPVEVHGSTFAYRGELHALVVVRDITERMQAYELLERRVEERTRELSTLLEVSNDVASTLELEPLLGLILDQLRAVVDYTDSSLLVFEGEDLVTVGYRGPVPQEQIMGTRFPPGRGRRMLEGAGEMMEPVIIDDVRGDAPLAIAYRQVVGEERLMGDFEHIRSWLGVPLVSKEQPIGLLAIIHEEPGHYTDRHIELATAFANQAAVAIENARLYERVQSAAVLEERQRLPRPAPDSVSQALYGITLGADAARKLLEQDPGRAAEPVDYILSLAQAGLAEMRALIFELRPESLESEGLIVALEKQAAALRARHEIPVRVTTPREEPDVPPEVKDALHRVSQEALHNTVKHACANHVEIRLECGTDGVVL